MRLTDELRGYKRVEFRVDKWDNHRTPEDGPPDSVDLTYEWCGPDGETVTDATIIGALDRYWAATQNEQANGETTCS